MANPKYSDEVKTRIVQSLACFDSPSAVAKAIKAEFGVEISPQACEAYDPNKVAGKKLSQRFRLLFEETRKTFLEDTAGIGISHRAVRLRKLGAQVTLSEQRGISGMVASLLEQAAEEMGNADTTRRELNGKDGKDLPAVTT